MRRPPKVRLYCEVENSTSQFLFYRIRKFVSYILFDRGEQVIAKLLKFRDSIGDFNCK